MKVAATVAMLLATILLSGCDFGGFPYSGASDDLDCDDIGHPVDVSGGDPNHLDADGDGIGCEGY